MKLRIGLILIALTLILQVYGAENVPSGHRIYGKETVGAIHMNGPLVLNGTKVLGHTQVIGSLIAQQSLFDSLHVTGPAVIKNSHVAKRTHISGPLEAEHCSFQNGLSVTGRKVSLSNCKATSLSIRKIEGYTGIQNIELRNGTEITGPLIVESGKGQIWLDLNTKPPSQIKGAKIVTEKLAD